MDEMDSDGTQNTHIIRIERQESSYFTRYFLGHSYIWLQAKISYDENKLSVETTSA